MKSELEHVKADCEQLQEDKRQLEKDLLTNFQSILEHGRGGFDFAVMMRVAVDGVFQTSGTLAAFVGDEVRGVATPSAVSFGPFMNQGTVLFVVSVWAAQTER